ncbi:hypothetical protein Lal_00013910 [Lupinus albus]|nr:hypothetical protein Lal_00013910 [Lupinus albus]
MTAGKGVGLWSSYHVKISSQNQLAMRGVAQQSPSVRNQTENKELRKGNKIMEGSTSSSEKKAKFQVPVATTLKEKRTKFYIVRKCIVMLLCWKDNGE